MEPKDMTGKPVVLVAAAALVDVDHSNNWVLHTVACCVEVVGVNGNVCISQGLRQVSSSLQHSTAWHGTAEHSEHSKWCLCIKHSKKFVSDFAPTYRWPGY